MTWKMKKALRERYKRVEKLKKELRMSRKCCMELDMLLSLGGIDLSGIELCPYPEELLKDVVDENGGKKC